MNETTISEAEWEIMLVVWANSPVTSQTIINVLTPKMDWKPSTIKTLINRLLNKGYIKAEKEGRAFLYEATVSEKEMLMTSFKALLGQTCARRSGELLQELITDTVLSQKDLARLEQVIQDKQLTAPLEVPCDCLPGQCQCHLFYGKGEK
ncbi:CopY/TcrY family copper transport repressor [Vagococcus lutrae]|uniref:CopY/TcrY family copper transport repressor n=1 Tax=Vagococcus lutrae TaxID=81947 RepID=UPI0019297DDE|nr:CopY/TcrY family copper transport repressor [Vagococcus lutrae]GEQ61974.1 CopY/TcrY family copper transport repressor [Vagococcus lutrae]GEQ63900.1 CopY/TcrY family copper transport repressor [Vagococcus lutrae]GEQ65798.1 CopY/TcrY family copper transport repressor [Vagococcus lutrae]